MADSLAIALSRHHAEEELRESESRYATTFAAVADGLWEWHVPSGKAFFSAIYYSMLGYEDGEFPASYDSWRRLVHPDDIGRVEQGLRQGLESGNGFNIELRMKMKSGDWGWVCTRGKVVEKDADGKALRMVGTLSDITERKRTERRQVLLSEILGILNSPVVLPDILNGVLSAIKRETGFDAMGIRLKSGDDYPYFSQDGFFKDFLLAENTLVKCDNDGGVCRDAKGNIILECTCGLVISGKTDPANPLFTSGGSFWTNNSFPLLDLPSDQDPRIHPRNRCIHDGYASIALIPIRAGQEIVGLLQLNNREKDSFTLDMIRFLEGICASIGMSLMQRHAEENYRTLFNEMLDGFALHEIICDSEGNPADYRFLAVNPAFERMTGLKTGEIVGRTILEVMPDTERYWIETYGNVALTGEPAFFENYSSELGKYFEVTVFRPAPRQFACIFSDITARKQGEEGKARLEQKLLESQKMQAVGQLAGGISHDFNNLLSVINGYSQLLVRNSDLKPAAVQQVEEILRAGERAAGLTRQLLVFSRHQTMELKIIDLNTIVSGTNKMLRRIVRENIEMAIIEGPNLGRIKADPGQIEQVIMNLVVNASDSMPNGGSITIKTENVKFGGNERVPNQVIKSGLYVMLSVSDTGCGMDNDVKEHIFEPFFTTKDVGKGTGLGLAIIYGIVKQANAYIDVQSELGKGTRFQIYFPQVVEEVTAEEEWRSVASFPRGSETIMISEDEESIRLMLEDFLKSIGYTVLTACNGKEALELAESHKGKIHLLLTDIVMPGMNGFELAKRLKKALPEIKLLFMTGYIKPTSTQEMMKIKDNLIDKPVSIHALSIKLREILG
jgi:PAS domain S-box-containing protein